MKKIIKEIVHELLFVLTGKSLDILLPPIVFFIIYSYFNITSAIVSSVIISILFLFKSIYKHEQVLYAVGGFIGVLIAFILSYIGNNASNFFIPDLLGTLLLTIVALISLIMKKPLAIYVSHITRGWPIEWFYRKDIFPAYYEVTILWLVFFVLRFSLELFLYLSKSVDELVIANVIMSFPLLIGILTVSYIYGIKRLKSLKGPSVDEYIRGDSPPYKGQIKGF
jgi:hypothetical protein